MTGTVQAVYENGVLRLLEPLELAEHERVIVTISCDGQGTLADAVPSTADPFVSYEGFDPLLDELSTSMTMADLPIACEVHRWTNLPQPRTARPHLDRWYAAMQARPSSRGVLDLALS